MAIILKPLAAVGEKLRDDQRLAVIHNIANRQKLHAELFRQRRDFIEVIGGKFERQHQLAGEQIAAPTQLQRLESLFPQYAAAVMIDDDAIAKGQRVFFKFAAFFLIGKNHEQAVALGQAVRLVERRV